MSIPAWIAVGTIVAVFLALQAQRRIPSDVLFLSGTLFLVLCGVVPPGQAFAGFSNDAILTIAGLLVCAAGLRVTGVLDWVGQKILGQTKSEADARMRLAAVLLALSAFLLNTAVVVMFMPVVLDWCRKCRVAPSRMLLPLSYFAILGGVCTLVGTSTILVLNGKLQEMHTARLQQLSAGVAADADDAALAARRQAFVHQMRPMRLFEISRVGIPCAIVGIVALLLTAPFVLPARTEISKEFDVNRREYLAEMLVRPDCPLIGNTVESAGLRQLPGLFLSEIDRGREAITPVSPHDRLAAGDRLIFSGVVSTLVDLENIPGLVPVADHGYEDDPVARPRRRLTEVVLSPSCPLIGTTVRDGSFRQRYNAAIVALHRNGVRVTNKIGNIVLSPGDTLLLQTRSDFANSFRESRDFYLVSDVAGFVPRRHEKARTAALLGVLLIVWLSLASFLPKTGMFTGYSSNAIAAFTVAMMMIGFRCLTASDARAAVDLPLVLTIVGALGLAKGLELSGAADVIAGGLVSMCGDQQPYVLLVVVYLLSMLFTEMITNSAVAVTMLPIAISMAERSGYSPRPFIMAVALAASLSFLTPIGYQTNLMVMTPGGYRPSDYLRAGLPVTVAVVCTALVVIPIGWPF